MAAASGAQHPRSAHTPSLMRGYADERFFTAFRMTIGEECLGEAEPGQLDETRCRMNGMAGQGAQKITGAHGVAPVIWKEEGKERRVEECCLVAFRSFPSVANTRREKGDHLTVFLRDMSPIFALRWRRCTAFSEYILLPQQGRQEQTMCCVLSGRARHASGYRKRSLYVPRL